MRLSISLKIFAISCGLSVLCPVALSSDRSASQGDRSASNAQTLVKVTISPSTDKVVRGSIYGLSATIQNTWSAPLILDLKSIQLVTVPELAPPGYDCNWSYVAQFDDEVKPTSVVLPPGSGIPVFFNLGLGDDTSGNCIRLSELGKLRHAIDFNPAEYNFTLIGVVRIQPPSTSVTKPKKNLKLSSPPSEPPPYFINSVQKIKVTISQWDTVGFSLVGSVLAALVALFRNKDSFQKFTGIAEFDASKPHRRTFIAFRNAAGGVLTGVAATVLASRLSDTAFPVKVSIDDFWGALVVGFVAFFVGGAFIDKLVDTTEKKPQA